jgi:hypothetical protein
MLDEMARDAVITIRIDSKDKKTLEAGARARGITLSAFVIRTLLGEAARTPAMAPVTKKEKVPPLFRTACEEAKRGGAYGYIAAGRLLISHAFKDPVVQRNLAALSREEVIPTSTDLTDELAELVFEENVPGVLAWCERYFPECLALVPLRRREQFAHGVIEAYSQAEDENNEELLAEARRRGDIDDEDDDSSSTRRRR